MIPQEGLKLLACVSMFVDHIGAVFWPYDILRIVGRLAFPLYCFLLVEGFYHTSDQKRYLGRLVFAALLSEFPYDYLFYGGITFKQQSVMVTLLLGYLSLLFMNECSNYPRKIISVIPFAILAEFVGADYGGLGVLIINLFGITRELPYKRILQTIGLLLLCREITSYPVNIFGVSLEIQLFAVLSMIPITLYSEKKITNSKLIQWVFYLFYPLHLACFYFI